MAKKRLTKKQELFIHHYLENGGNGVQACKSAGYSGSVNTLNQMSRDNLQNPTIKQAIDKVNETIKEELIYSAREKREMLFRVAQYNSMVEVKKYGDNETEAMKDPKAVISAIAELNKMDGDHSPKRIDQNGEIKVYLDADDQLLGGLE